MDRNADLIPSSPSNSSPSSSDLDTESTGSFFPDRSTTLGTLMGVSFPGASAAALPSVPSRCEHGDGGGDPSRRDTVIAPEQRQRRRRRNRGWWRLCRDDMARPTSLGDFLRVERRMAGGEVADGHFVLGDASAAGTAEHVAIGGGPLFADGRVLPPALPEVARRRPRQRVESVGRIPQLLITGICSGGEG